MSEFLKSALTNISSNWANNNSNYIDQENEFIGQIVELKGHRLKVEKVLAKGGYGFVFKVRDARNQENYALKRLIASCKESKSDIMNEIKILTKLQAHPHIMKFISWGQMENNMVYLVLCELCGGGSLSDLKLPLETTQQLNKILYQTANAISHLHRLNIIHRDIKAENILFDNNGFVKLCDFGSATMESFHPNPDWTALQRSIVEDEMKRKTTPIYRPPEILDTYLNYKINKSMDIWALGCMIYLLKFKEHPFKEYSVLQIVNCCYNFPAGSGEDVHTELIKSCLKINPDTRITIEGIIEVLENNFVDLIAPCVSPKLISPSSNNIFKNMYNNSSFIPNNVNIPGTAQSSFGLSGFTKYLKDTSNKVMQTVQQSITKQDLDLSYLTSNLIVMSYPAEGLESTYRNHYEDVKAYLDSRNCPFMIINVSGRTYGSYKFGHNTKLINGDDSWKDTNKISSFLELIEISDKISDWLNDQKNKKLVVIHCLDGKINSSIMVNAFLLYVGMFKNYEASSNFFAVKRCPINLNAAHKRYLEYVTNFKLKNKIELFDQKSEKVIVKSIIMNGIPLFSKNRDGCRPVLEIYTEKDKKIFSSLKDFEEMIVYNKVCDFRVHWKDLNIECNSKNDLYIIIYHARSGLGSRMLQSKMINFIKICSVQFNLTMERKVESGTQILKFDLINLDSIDEVEKYPREFKMAIEIEYTKQTNDNEKLPNKLTEATFDIINLFESYEELEDCKDTFSCKRPKIEETNKTDFKSSKSSPNLFTRNDVSKENSEKFDLPKTPSSNNLEEKPCCSNTYSKEKTNSISNDLLNLGLNESKLFSDKTIPCDLLGNFDDSSQQSNAKNLDLLNDLISEEKSNQRSTNTSNLDLLNELFLKDNLNNEKNLGPDLLNEPKEFKSKENFNNFFANNNQKKNLDPFDDFFEKSNTNKLGNYKTEPLKPIPSKKASNDLNSKNNTKKINSFPTNSNKQKPDYNRSYFNEPKPTTSKISEDAFGDLLGGFSIQNDKNKTNKSMAELRKEEMLRDGSIDPLRLKVNDWKENKTRNIRALLGSLHTIVWPDCNWTQVGMNQLINKPDVKKMYRKACLAVHPDKLMGTEHEELAKLIFVELNDAWNEFEKQTQFQN